MQQMGWSQRIKGKSDEFKQKASLVCKVLSVDKNELNYVLQISAASFVLNFRDPCTLVSIFRDVELKQLAADICNT